jgi:ABC-2 type transport system permease protein
MARLLVQLKLRLVTNALRASTGAQVAFVLSTMFAAVVAVGIFYLLAILRGSGIAAADLSTVIFSVFALAWLILPLVVFSLDSTLDPATLTLYPLRTRPLAVGLLAASATGAWPAATLLGLLGVTIGLARGALGVLVALVAVPLYVLFCITMARFVTTALAGTLRSRRGKDFAALLFIPIFAVYEGFFQVVPKLASEGALTASSFGGVDTWLRWTPPGLAVHAIWDASSGHLGTALLRLALLAGIIVVLGAAWIRSLSRAMVTTDTSTQSAVRAAALPFARYGLRGTVAARFWIYQRREPYGLIYWGITAVIMAVVAFRLVLSPDWFGGLLASGAAGGAFVGAFHNNAIGMSGPGFGLEAMALNSRRALRAWFSGQNIALAAVGVPLLTAVCFGLAAVAKHPMDGFLAVAVGLAGIGAGLALANLFTVASAYPVEKRAGTPMPRAVSGHNGEAVGSQLITLLGVGLAVTPVILAAVFARTHAAAIWMPVLVMGGAAYGLALVWGGVRGAAAVAEEKLPELAQIAIQTKL